MPSIFLFALSLTLGVRAKTCEPWVLSELVSQSRLEGARLVGEDDLRQEGLGRGYTAGLDALGGMFRAAEFLRSPGVDPAGTHVEYFASLVGDHLDTVEDGIRSWRGRFNWRGFWEQDIDNRLTLLAIFRAEAQKRLREGRVTYRWWLNFNFRLSILATPRRKRSTDFAGGLVKELYRTGDWVSDESLEAAYLRPNLEGGDPGTGAVVTTLFSNFPHIIAVPSVEPLGTMPFDRTFLTGVHPVGLTGRAVRADGEKMYPDAFSRHDLEHLHTRIKWDIPPLHGSNHREAWRNKRRRLVLFHNEFIPRADALALREKGMAYLMYYIANHEYPSQLLSFLLTPGKILRYLPFRDIAKDLKKMGSSAPLPEGLYRDSVDHIGDYLMDAAKLFDRMAVEIWDDLGIRPQ